MLRSEVGSCRHPDPLRPGRSAEQPAPEIGRLSQADQLDTKLPVAHRHLTQAGESRELANGEPAASVDGQLGHAPAFVTHGGGQVMGVFVPQQKLPRDVFPGQHGRRKQLEPREASKPFDGGGWLLATPGLIATHRRGTDRFGHANGVRDEGQQSYPFSSTAKMPSPR